MIISPFQQAYLFAGSVIIGFALGFVYDLLRLFRKIVPHPRLLISVEDFLYWIFVSLSAFYFILSKNFGEVRAFSVAGFFIGLALYFFTLSPLFMKFSDLLLELAGKLLAFAFKIILIPFKAVVLLLSIPLNFLKKHAVIVYRAQRKRYGDIKAKGRMKRIKFINNLKIMTKKK